MTNEPLNPTPNLSNTPNLFQHVFAICFCPPTHTCDLTTSVFHPPPLLPVSAQEEARGALEQGLGTHGTCWSLWHLSAAARPGPLQESRHHTVRRTPLSWLVHDGRPEHQSTCSKDLKGGQLFYSKHPITTRSTIFIRKITFSHLYGPLDYWFTWPLEDRQA